ncbi:histidine phosphatase family protein [Eupransor demetentiae]|uniref:Broad specificity phosphatase PhoE (PhoE) n=1 Tax=Eupransor demetentiae TaxID=3109584 RepID=A0ABM9N6B6_9LACO|nr:Broad specificity phosphatase PhoE (PhoE) [Lactobacillaceae bacterium LMG 33000]
MAIQIYLVRHGETYFNLLRRLQGFSDAPLTEKGIQDGKKAGQRLAKVHFAGAYSSDLTRAIHTAQYALSQNQADSPKKPVQLPDFREENFGTFEGMDSQMSITYLNGFTEENYPSYNSMVQELGMPGLMDLFHDHDPYKLAESYADWQSRIERGFADIRKRHQDGDKVLIVSHGTTIRGIATLLGRPELSQESIKNGAVTRIDLDVNSDAAKIVEFNNDEKVFD